MKFEKIVIFKKCFCSMNLEDTTKFASYEKDIGPAPYGSDARHRGTWENKLFYYYYHYNDSDCSNKAFFDLIHNYK